MPALELDAVDSRMNQTDATPARMDLQTSGGDEIQPVI